MKKQSSSLAGQLASITMWASGTALLVACLMLVAYDFFTFRGATLDNRLAQAQIVGSNTVTALTFDDPETAERTLAALRAVSRIEGAGLYRPDGRLFAAYLRDEAVAPLMLPPLPPGAAEWHRMDGLRTMHVVRPVVLDGQPVGLVYIRSDLGDIRERFFGYTFIAAIVALLSIVAARVVSNRAARTISEPLTELATLAGRLSVERDFSVRATVRGRGELALLIAEFNEMLSQIQARDRSLQESHDLLERRVEERTAALNESNKELEAFCYSVSHDLRSPLRSIDGFSQALLEDLGSSLDPEAADYLARIRAATQRMGTLIDDLLNLSRITRAQLVTKPVDLTAMARGVIDDCRMNHPDRVVDVVIAEGLRAHGDPRLLHQVLENLLGNAWKFTSKRPDARVEFGSTEREGQIVYFVADNGAGFDPAYAQRLFGVFQRLHAMTEFPGTGVGLAIVDRIVRRHGGQIWADAAVDKGATFYFTLTSPPDEKLAA